MEMTLPLSHSIPPQSTKYAESEYISTDGIRTDEAAEDELRTRRERRQDDEQRAEEFVALLGTMMSNTQPPDPVTSTSAASEKDPSDKASGPIAIPTAAIPTAGSPTAGSPTSPQEVPAPTLSRVDSSQMGNLADSAGTAKIKTSQAAEPTQKPAPTLNPTDIQNISVQNTAIDQPEASPIPETSGMTDIEESMQGREASTTFVAQSEAFDLGADPTVAAQSGDGASSAEAETTKSKISAPRSGVNATLPSVKIVSPDSNSQSSGKSVMTSSTNETTSMTDPRMASHQTNSSVGSSDASWLEQFGDRPKSDSQKSNSLIADPVARTTSGVWLAGSELQIGSSATNHSSLSPLDLTASIAEEIRQPLSSQVSRAVMDHIEKRGSQESDTLTVRLDPPELGELVIELSNTREGLAVRVTAREAVTMDMLFARGSEIETQLRGEKIDLQSLEFLSPDMMNSNTAQRDFSQDADSPIDGPRGSKKQGIKNRETDAGVPRQSIAGSSSQHALSFRA